MPNLLDGGIVEHYSTFITYYYCLSKPYLLLEMPGNVEIKEDGGDFASEKYFGL